eukprot:3379999-Prymnesium_polylepis.1
MKNSARGLHMPKSWAPYPTAPSSLLAQACAMARLPLLLGLLTHRVVAVPSLVQEDSLAATSTTEANARQAE